MEYSFWLFLLVFVVCLRNGNTQLISAHCDANQVTLSCPENTVIRSLVATSVNSSCQTANKTSSCRQIINSAFNTTCISKTNCTLNFNSSPLNNCTRTPRYITATYQCKWIRKTSTVSTTICANKLPTISCTVFNTGKWSSYKLTIKEVSFIENSNVCSSCKNSDAKRLLEHLCNNKTTCDRPSDDKSCLFLFYPAPIMYNCADNSNLTSFTFSPLTTKSGTTLVNTTDLNTVVTVPSDEGSFLATSHVDNEVHVKLDNEGRVLISGDMFGNVTVMLCGEGWDDQDAQVVCRYKENTGHAMIVKSIKDYETIPVVIHCYGNETNLLECNYELMEQCNVSTVAAVTCCDDSSGLRIVCPSQQAEKLSSPEFTKNIAIGLSVGLSAIIIIGVVVVIRSNRCKREKNLLSISNKLEDYVGNQDIALPNLDKKTEKHFPLSSGTIGIKTDLANDEYEFAKSIGAEYNVASGDTYAFSEDGVYDKFNNNRHVTNESNVYSHSIDTVYDNSDRSSNKELTTATYDHFIGPRSDDNYDLAMRK